MVYVPTPTPAAPVEDNIPLVSTNAVTAKVRVARPADCKRVRLAYHVFTIPGVSHADMIRNVRLRTFRWVRRVFAQAGIAPKIEFISTTAIPPPVPNMICILNFGAKGLCSGVDAAGAPATVTLVFNDSGADVSITATLPAPDPAARGVPCREIGRAIAEAVNAAPGGFTAVIENVPKSDLPLDTGSDVFIAKDGRAVPIKKVTDTDTFGAIASGIITVPGLRKKGGRVTSLEPHPSPEEAFFPSDNDGLIGGDAMQRRILRVGRAGENPAGADPFTQPPQDDRIDIYVIPRFRLAGRAYPDYRVLPPDNDRAHDISDPDFDAPTPLKNSVIVAYETDRLASSLGWVRVMDESDASPFTLPHEIGHVLGRVTHNEAQGDLMAGRWPKHANDSGMADTAPDANGVHAAKRIFGGALMVGTLALKNNQLGSEDLAHYPRDMRELMRTRAGHLLESW